MLRLVGAIVVLGGCHVVFPLTDPSFKAPEPVELAWSWVGTDDPSFSGDLLEMYVNQGSAIARSTRATIDEPWPAPVVVTELVSGTSADTTPDVLADGLAMYFASDRGTEPGIYDVFVTARGLRTQPWSMPVRIQTLTTINVDSSPSADASNLSIVTTVRVKADNEDLHLSERSLTTDPWPVPDPIDAINSDDNDQAGFLTADGLAIYFTSNRTGSVDLFVSRRASKLAAFEEPEPLTELNSDDTDADPWVSPDGNEIYFVSNRRSRFELWHATR